MVDNVRMFCKALGERPHKIKANKDLFIGASKQTLFVDTQGGGYLQVGGSLLYLVITDIGILFTVWGGFKYPLGNTQVGNNK